MEWSRALQAAGVVLLGTLALCEVAFLKQPAATIPSPTGFAAAVGSASSQPVAERVLNRERRARALVHPYEFYTISPRYYYQNSPFHQTRYSYYNGYNYFYPNYDPPRYYYGSPYSIGLSLEFDQDSNEPTPTSLTPE